MILSYVTWLPLLGAIILMFVDKKNDDFFKKFSLFISLAVFAISLKLWFGYDEALGTVQFIEKFDWIPSLGISYSFGIDGISMLLIMLTTFLTPIIILSSYEYIGKRKKEYYIHMLIIETALIGVFVAQDLFLFYIFWELVLIPMYFMIGIWGGENKLYATVKLFIYTMVGSVLMLAAIMYLYFLTPGSHTFDIQTIYNVSVPLGAQTYLFLAFSLAFAIKVPLFPFHTWLPDAHVQAPTGGSVILAGVMLKMGTYGFLRFALPFFPEASASWAMFFGVISVIGIIYGALVAMIQTDVKKLVAYSSVSHLGFVILGIFALNLYSVEGSIYVMLAHGLSTGGLFLMIGMLYERTHTREIKDFGGLATSIPQFTKYFMIMTLASVGLPLTSGFVGEFLVLLGTFEFSPTLTVFAASGVVLGAVYMLWMFRRVFFGEITNKKNENLPDLTVREKWVLIPIIVMIIVMGVYPKPFMKKMEKSVEILIEQVKK